MIVLTGSVGQTDIFRPLFTERNDMGIMLSPRSWRAPWCAYYACDNDMFAHRHDPDWWRREGETNWLRMLDKIARFHRPLFVLLPDVVYDWPRTLERAYCYYDEVNERGLPAGIALQDGCDTEEQFRAVDALGIDTVFIGGSVRWKWRMAEPLRKRFPRHWLHVGRASGPWRVRECLCIKADSCDGTGYVRHSRAMIPPLLRVLDGRETQLRLALCGALIGA